MDASAPVGTTWTCGDELSQIMESETVNVPFGGPFTAVVFREHNEDEENLSYWYQYNYTVPGLGYVKEVDWWNDNPPRTTELVEIQYPVLAPMRIGQKFIYKKTDSANPPNSWNFELRVIKEVSMCSNDYFHFQIWNDDNEGEVEDGYARSTENNIYECDTDSGVECSTFGSGTVGTTWTCGDSVIEIMESEEVSVPYGGPYTSVVNKKYNKTENSPPRYVYFVPRLGWVKQVDYWTENPPPSILELVEIQYPSSSRAMPWIPLMLLDD